jgi:dihydroorotate dehydrogenase (NAD+) catalytic subunit
MPDLRVTLGSLTLANPVLAAAGTFGYGLEFARAVRLERLGALITKTLTLQPRDGHPPPRLVDTPAGMLNAVGLQNVGLDAFLREKLPALRDLRVPLIVSVLGEAAEELARMARALDGAEGVAALELNLSCPNLRRSEANGRRVSFVAHEPDAVAGMVAAARAATRKPLLAKLSPDVTDLVPIAQAAERAGADALTLGNTFVGMSLDPATKRSRLGTVTGGLSGPAIRPLAVYRVWYTARSVSIPLVGLGGIVRAEDALEFFLAGAAAVAVGTANFADPAAPLRVLRGLERHLERHRIASLKELRGALQE